MDVRHFFISNILSLFVDGWDFGVRVCVRRFASCGRDEDCFLPAPILPHFGKWMERERVSLGFSLLCSDLPRNFADPFLSVPKLSCSKNTESTRVDQTFPLLPDFQASKPGLPFCSYGIASGPDSLALNSPRKSVEFHHGGGEISPWWWCHSTMVEF